MPRDTPMVHLVAYQRWLEDRLAALSAEEQFSVRALTTYFATSLSFIIVGLTSVVLLTGRFEAYVPALPQMGLGAAGLFAIHRRAFDRARRICVLFLISGGLYSFLFPTAGTEIFLASNLPTLFLWLPHRLRRLRRVALVGLVVEYLLCSIGSRYWSYPLLGPEGLAVASVAVDIIFPLDLLSTVRELLLAKAVQQEALREARDAAVSASRVKTRILNAVAHELRTPLAACLGLLGEGENKHGATEESAASRSAIEAALRRTTDLLDLARLEGPGGAQAPRPQHRVPAEDLEAQLRGFPEADVDLADELSAPFSYDAGALARTTLHLVENAHEHGQPPVRVTGRYVEGCLVVDVEDGGPGLPESFEPELHRAFETGARGADDARSGIGVGLALSKALVQRAGGGLEVLPRSLGSGIRAWVPAESKPGPAPAPLETPLSLRVLVVEDEAVNRLIIERALERIGCRVELAADGLEAVAAVSRERFDFVLMDVRMPHMDGLTATKVIKRSADAPPIVALTANALAGDRDRCLEAGMDDFLSKPLRVPELLSVLAPLVQPL